VTERIFAFPEQKKEQLAFPEHRNETDSVKDTDKAVSELQSIIIEDFEDKSNMRLNRSYENASTTDDIDKAVDSECKSATIRHTKFGDNKKKNARSSSLSRDIIAENRLFSKNV